jgi:hypothetical protein
MLMKARSSVEHWAVVKQMEPIYYVNHRLLNFVLTYLTPFWNIFSFQSESRSVTFVKFTKTSMLRQLGEMISHGKIVLFKWSK